MKGLFIPDITVEMFRNGCLESIEELMARGEMYDIDYPSEQEPKTGKWINYNWSDTNGTCRWGIKCSQCNKEYKYGAEVWLSPNYCPNCGAKMEVEE